MTKRRTPEPPQRTVALSTRQVAGQAAGQTGRLEDISAHVEVRRHPGARRLTLRISRTRRAVIVTIPVQCDLDEAGTFLNRHIDWVRERLDNLPAPVPFRTGTPMPLRGEPHRIVFTGDMSSRLVTTAREPLQRPEILVPGARQLAPRRLREWLFNEARRDLDGRVAFHAKTLKVRAKKITVRDQCSRWGSCSSTGALSFSWRLILAPPHVLDYVAAHEVAHLAEMNHGPRFWALVEKTVPDYQVAKQWLHIYGLDLHRFGATPEALS